MDILRTILSFTAYIYVTLVRVVIMAYNSTTLKLMSYLSLFDDLFEILELLS